MILFLLIFALFMLHVQFLVRHILFGASELRAYVYYAKYPFDSEVALESLNFVLLCVTAIFFSYYLVKKYCPIPKISKKHIPHTLILNIMNTFGVLIISYFLYITFKYNFNYKEIAIYRDTHAIFFESRIFYLILLSNLFLNISFTEFFYSRTFKASMVILCLYVTAIILIQARSLLFELFIVFFYSHSIKNSEKIRIKYILGVIVCMFIPNIIVLLRTGETLNPLSIIDALFTFEYSIAMSSFLGAAMEFKDAISDRISLLPSLNLLIPSFIRNFFNISAVKSDHYQIISLNAEQFGGGFSLLGDLYLYFGWFTPLFLGVIVGFISYLNSFIRCRGFVQIKFSVTPLIYACFLLSLRNDVGVFVKYFIQALFIAYILDTLIMLLSRKKFNE